MSLRIKVDKRGERLIFPLTVSEKNNGQYTDVIREIYERLAMGCDISNFISAYTHKKHAKDRQPKLAFILGV